MRAPAGALPTGWPAELDLRFARRGDSTVMIRNLHRGPLQVQKALYPERRDTCHIAILHPPGGIAAGDSLGVDACLDTGASALLTTPGATKWYRSGGEWASQTMRFAAAQGATLEWLPRENIFFDGSRVALRLDVDLSADAGYFGWDILSFGRRASGESWRRGQLRMQTSIRRDGRLLWAEMANIDADSGFLHSAAGLAGFTVCGTLVVAGYEISRPLLDACRDACPTPAGSRVGMTRLPSVLVARYLGDSAEDAFQWFVGLWKVSRPELAGKAACPPRVWAC